MKVLYFVRYANALSESYIRAEANYAMSRGVEIFFCAQRVATDAYPLAEGRFRTDGNLEAAVEEFKPDVIHVHWLTELEKHAFRLAKTKRPVTVRGHSFDVMNGTVEFADSLPFVKRIWIFPHFAERYKYAKVRPLPVAYNSGFFRRFAMHSDRKRVVRAAAGLSGKGIMQFVEIAKLAPDFKFTLAITSAVGEKTFHDKVTSEKPANLTILGSLQHDDVGELMQKAAIYVRSYEKSSHDWGMPISVAEAMACGMLVLLPDIPEARAYAGSAGEYFSDTHGAVEILRKTTKWSELDWNMQSEEAELRSDLYKPSEVMPPLVNCWESILMNEV